MITRTEAEENSPRGYLRALGRLRQPAIRATVGDLINRSLRDAKLSREPALVSYAVGARRSDLTNLPIRQLAFVVGPGLGSIGRIVRSSAEVEMVRIHTGRGVALREMKHELRVADRASMNLPREPMRLDIVPPFIRAVPVKSPVSERRFRSGPNPTAGVILSNLKPKTFLESAPAHGTHFTTQNRRVA